MSLMCDRISPDHISDFLLIECRDHGDILTNLKLQKLLYYAQAWYLAQYDKSLFTEDFQAWIHGPVLLSQYQRFKKFEWYPITEDLNPPSIEKHVVDHLREIVHVFGIETALTLELMTHNEEPWKNARKGIPANQSSKAVISKDSMQSFYKKLE